MKSAKIKKIAVSCLAGLALMFSLVGLSSCKGKNIVSEYTVNDTFENIYINTSTADITICASLDGVCKVVSSASVYDRYNVSVQDGTLTVDLENIRKWYQFFDVNFDKSTLTVYLPETEYKGLIVDESTGDMDIQSGLQFESMDLSLSTGDVKCHASATELVKIKASTGNIIVENMQTKSMDISVSTGDVKVTDIVCDSLTASGKTSCFNGANIQASGAVTIIRSTGDILLENIQAEALTVTSDTGDQTISTATCGNVTLTITTGETTLTSMACANFTSTGDTGDLTMNNVIASGNYTIERSTGDVTFNGCDAAELLVEVSTGDVTGTLLTEKVFIVRSSTGEIFVPETITGGKCKITTSTGCIHIEIPVN